MNSARSTLIVCEQSGEWASAIRRLFSRQSPKSARASSEEAARADRAEREVRGAGAVVEDYRIVETRTADHCLNEFGRAASALVALELTSGASEQAFELLSTIADRHPRAKVVVLASRVARRYEWLARELGAIHFIASPRQLAPLTTIATRHWKIAKAQEVTPPEGAHAVETIWQSLPWG